jgi:hypothetical protein
MDVLGAAMCGELRLVPMNFTVNLDAGATFPASGVAAQTALLGSHDVGIGHCGGRRQGSSAATGFPGIQ